MSDAGAPGKHADSAGVKIHYQDGGRGSPLLVLNGWTASGLIWPEGWVRALEADHRVLRVCNRGTGWSDPVRDPFTMADMVADALAVLDAAGVGRAHIFGLSMGGMIAQQLAVSHPERVDRLVLCATAPPPPDFVTADPAVFSRLFTPPPGATSADEIVGAVWSSIVGPGFQERGKDVLDRLVAGAVARPTPLEVIMLQMQAIASRTGDPADIAGPTLVIHGAADPLLPVANGRRLGQVIPGAHYVELAGVGHLVPWEEPAATGLAMKDFLASSETPVP
ncbi:MAG: alpha/beta fold hydrolase [Acidimicrobiia bacterium]|nr:alpha/beta fold hydrolase [Acidimicrobiia bacterium]